jgi:hypothetical protein
MARLSNNIRRPAHRYLEIHPRQCYAHGLVRRLSLFGGVGKSGVGAGSWSQPRTPRKRIVESVVGARIHTSDGQEVKPPVESLLDHGGTSELNDLRLSV